jgi:hypothetical protein
MAIAIATIHRAFRSARRQSGIHVQRSVNGDRLPFRLIV